MSKQSKSAHRINYLAGPPYVLSNSLRSCDSNVSSNSSRGEVHINGAYESTESGRESSRDLHEYDSIINAVATGPRRKENFTYESALPSPALPPRTRQITESDRYSHSRSSSSSSAETFPKKGGAYLSKFMLFIILVILAVSVAALVLVILTIFGTLGPKCGCTEGSTVQSPRTGMSGVSVQSLLRRIQDLEKNMIAMKAETEARESAINVLVTKLENQVEFLQKQVSKHETASKVAFVDGSAEKKLDTEIRLLNKSVNALKSNDNELTSKVNELRQNQTYAKRRSDRLTANVTQLQSRVQELKKASSNMSTRAGSLERGYAQMNTVVKSLQGVNSAQNASHEALRLAFMRMKDSMVVVNTTLYNELGAMFNSCEYRMIEGTTVSSGADASVSYTEPSDKRVVGIACSTDFADEYKLKKPLKAGRYECTCHGVAPSATSGGNKPATIKCYLHLWECPIKK